MKRFLAMVVSIVLTLPVLATAVVFAEDTTQNNSTTTSSSATDSAATVAKALADRIDKRKTELKTKLTNSQKVRLQSRCKAAQGLLSSASDRIKGLETSRSQVYDNVSTNLTNLSEKLKNKGVDTTELNTDIDALKVKVTTFNTDLATLKQDVSDLAAMDCTTDPDGFKASLETARTAQGKVREDSQAIRSYISDTIKPLLVTIRTQLAKSSGEGQ